MASPATPSDGPGSTSKHLDAFEMLYREHFDFTWSVVRRLGVPTAALDDALQELWLLVHRHQHRLHTPEGARGWLFQIARRVASHHRRANRRHRRKLDGLAHHVRVAPPPAGQREFASRPSGVESALIVEAWLSELDEPKRSAFILSELQGWTAPEIARVLGISVNTIYSRVRLAKEQLRAHLQAEEATVEALLAEARAQPGAPRGAANRAWLLLAGQLPKSSAVAGFMSTWAAIKGAAVGLGAAAVVAVVPGAVTSERHQVLASELSEPRAAVPASPTSAIAEDGPAVAVQAPTVEDVPLALHVAPPRTSGVAPRSEARLSTSGREAKATRARSALPELLREDDAAALASAQIALTAGDLVRARSLLEQHENRFPSTQLRDIRELLHIKLACMGRDLDGARRRIEAAERARPGSVFAKRARATCSENMAENDR